MVTKINHIDIFCDMIFNLIFICKNIFAGVYLFVINNGHNPFTETLRNNYI